jgi:hypothetical protein
MHVRRKERVDARDRVAKKTGMHVMLDLDQ